jgi:hypothetical protein
MGKKFVPVQRATHKYRLFLADIKKVSKCELKKTPPLPLFTKNDVSPQITADPDLSFEPMLLSDF